ncbi:STAS/SEC14 domain-containing protein [Bernardetia sp.]|uniref:STAS/SEC14 domain-containing protein n=1 Tax=Bernardetia sp. TaxID=1937974 RepID=UPI0025BA2864|nr:STAS/SEC14 domain-containing protein [Bernardetia sp.]
MVLYEVENAFLFYDRQYDMISFKWLGAVSDEEYRTAVKIAYEKTVEFEVTRWLTDTREGKVVSVEAQQWMLKEFIPNYIAKSPLRRVAFLVSKDIFRQEYIDKVKQSFDNYQIEVFEDPKKAKKWLTKMYSKKEDIENELRRQANS